MLLRRRRRLQQGCCVRNRAALLECLNQPARARADEIGNLNLRPAEVSHQVTLNLIGKVVETHDYPFINWQTCLNRALSGSGSAT